MDSGILIALILGSASIVSSICFGLVPNVRKNRIEKLESQRNKLFRDISLFYDIEDELLDKLEALGCNKKSTKQEIRKIVSNKHGGEVLSKLSNPSEYKKHL
jgi:Na+-translocating ferredoxin:NAD+ oxidoreductase RnfG subunit